MIGAPELVHDGFRFPEGSRWYDGRLWFSDMLAGRVYCSDVATGELEEVLAVDDQTSGLGWLPDGSLVVSCMLSRTLRRRTPDGRLEVLADLSDRTPWPLNDLVTDASGRTYLGGFGYDYYSGAAAEPSSLYVVETNGSVDVAADGLCFPNGSVVLPGTSTLVVAETMAPGLTAFDIGDDGRLTNRRTWASLPGTTPDGICVDAEHGIWVGSIFTSEFLRVVEGGTVTDRIHLGSRGAIDCVLGGSTLFLMTCGSAEDVASSPTTGRVEAVEVSVPGPQG